MRLNTGSATGSEKDDRGNRCICCIVVADLRGCEGVYIWVFHCRHLTADISGDRGDYFMAERSREMRPIDADELKKKLYKDTTGWSHGEHPMIVEESDIDACETIEAIPVSWIDYHIKVEEMHGNGNGANAEALKWIRNEWKREDSNNDN